MDHKFHISHLHVLLVKLKREKDIIGKKPVTIFKVII